MDSNQILKDRILQLKRLGYTEGYICANCLCFYTSTMMIANEKKCTACGTVNLFAYFNNVEKKVYERLKNPNDSDLSELVILGDCVKVMREMPDNFIDLTVTSPPYDHLRKYNGYQLDLHRTMIELYRITKKGGVVVWVVGDATVRGSETCSAFKQALKFKSVGFNLHDTMIYQKTSLPLNHRRYEQDFEYMFVFSKGRPKTFNPIKVPTKYPETNRNGYYGLTDEKLRRGRSGKKRQPVGEEKIKGNIWYYPVGKNHSTKDKIAFKHPAIFPEQLAADHINSWSNKGDLIFDPMCGSGTTLKMAKSLYRSCIGIDISQEYCDISKERLALIV